MLISDFQLRKEEEGIMKRVSKKENRDKVNGVISFHATCRTVAVNGYQCPFYC